MVLVLVIKYKNFLNIKFNNISYFLFSLGVPKITKTITEI